jgi:hypothetical protein
VKTIREPTEEKNKRFAKQQEACMKDVDRAFGVLQSRWALIQHSAMAWKTKMMWEVMTTCVIMHNMLVEDERDEDIHDQG